MTDTAGRIVSAEYETPTYQIINCETAEFLEDLEKAISHLYSRGGELDAALSHQRRVPGKRIRGQIVFAIGALDICDRNRLLQVAAAIEAIHEASLIHDDIVDGSQERRGQPSLMAQFGLRCAGYCGSVLVGRGIEALSEHLGDALPAEDIFSLLREMADAQILEWLPPADLLVDQKRRLTAVIDGKTGALFRVAVSAAIAAVGPGHLATRFKHQLLKFGSCLGRAFQIRDDLLDLEDPALLKRDEHMDLRQGVLSFPLMCWAENQENWRDTCRQLMRYGEWQDDGDLRQQILLSDAPARTRQAIDDYLTDACSGLEQLPDSLGLARLKSTAEALRL